MIYGPAYDSHPARCEGCDWPITATMATAECYKCGARGCTACLIEVDAGEDRQTGYRDVNYICPECAGELADEKAADAEFNAALECER